MDIKLISIPIEEFNKLERIKALYEEALGVIAFYADGVYERTMCTDGTGEIIINKYDEGAKAREFLEKVK